MLSPISVQHRTKSEEVLPPDTALPPLPNEVYPLVLVPRKRERDYYVTLIVVSLLRSIMPLSAIYLIIFPVIVPRLRGAKRIIACLLAFYALAEVIFAVYYACLVREVQSRPVGAKLPDDSRDAMVHQILAMGLSSSHTDGTLDSEVDGDHTIMRTELESDTTLAEVSGRADESNEKSWISTSLSASDQPAPRGLTGKASQGALLTNGSAVEFRERLRTWFNHAPWESLRRENVLIWLSWVCLDLPIAEARKNEQYVKRLDNTLERLEERTGHKLLEDFNPDITANRLTLDPVVIKMRPLLLYAVPALLNAYLKAVTFRSWGLRNYSDGKIEYLVRIPPGWTPLQSNAGLPVIYLHGLGFGLVTSYPLIKSLIKSLHNQPLLIPLQPHTSQSIFHPRHLKPWTRGEFIESISRMCTKFGFWTPPIDGAEAQGGCSILSHSNGSVPHAWILKDIPSLALRNTFVDPIVFCIWEGDMTHSVCYRKPATAMELLMSYLIASEIGIALYIRRHFDWTENTLFFDEIPAGRDHTRTAFFLGGKDMVIDAPRARKYLELHGVTSRSLHWDPDGAHGKALLGASRDRVVRFAGTGYTPKTSRRAVA